VITRPLVIIESPYAGELLRNISYARAAVRDSVLRGEAPMASHLLFSQAGVLYDDIAEEREMGIEAGLAWARVSSVSTYETDLAD
jgi:hypothetical protein